MQRKGKARICSMLLIVVMVFAVILAGCGSNGDNVSTSTTAASSTQTATSSSTAAAASSTLPPVELKWYVTNAPQKDTQAVVDAVNKLIQPKINATISYNELDWGTYQDKLTVMLQAGEQVDLLFTANWWLNFVGNAAKGSFYPMNDLLDKYGQDIKAQLDSKYWPAVSIKGNIYMVPSYQGYAQPIGLTFKKDLVDKYGFDYKSVKSLKDIEPYFETIKKNEPGITPLLMNPNTALNSTFAPEKAKDTDVIAGWASYIVATGKVGKAFENADSLAFYTFMRDIYNKGYLAKDAATKTDTLSEAKSAKYAVIENTQFYNDGVKTTKDYGYPTYDVAISQRPYITTSQIQAGIAIGKTSKNPERAMMMINLLWSDKEIFNTLGFGIENKHWVWADDAKTTVNWVLNSGYDSHIPWEFGNAFNKYYTQEEGKDFMDPQAENNEKTPASPIMGFVYDGTNVKTEAAQMDAIIAQYLPLLNTGSVDPVKTLETLNSKLKSAGIDKAIADVEAQLAQWKKDNGK